MTDLYHEIESRETTDPADSRLWPDSHVQSRGIVLHVNAEHWATACVTFSYREELYVRYGNGTKASPLGSRHAIAMGISSSPSTKWEVEDGIESARIIEIAMALVRDEVHGDTRKRFTYDLVWATLRDNPDVHPWVRERFPGWARLVIDDDHRVWPATSLRHLQWSSKRPHKVGWWWFTKQSLLDHAAEGVELAPLVRHVSQDELEAEAIMIEEGGTVDKVSWYEHGWRCCPITYMGMHKARRDP